MAKQQRRASGHMRRRGQSWQLMAYIGRDADGTRQYETETHRGITKAEAKVLLGDLVQRVAKANAKPDVLTVRAVADKWITVKRKSVVQRWGDEIWWLVDGHLLTAHGDRPIRSLKQTDLEDLYLDMQDEGLSAATIRKLHYKIEEMLSWAVRRGHVTRNVATGIELPKATAPVLWVPDSGDVRRVVETALALDTHTGHLINFAAWTGCRRSEAIRLRWRDVDLVSGSVAFLVTKTGKPRRVAIGPRTLAMLREYRLDCERIAATCGGVLDQSAYVFSPHRFGHQPYSPGYITACFIKACKEAGVSMRLHDLRHHSATTLLKAGVSVGEVMDRHGWTSVSMVSRYRHLMDATDQRAAAATEEAIQGSAAPAVVPTLVLTDRPLDLPAAAAVENAA